VGVTKKKEEASWGGSRENPQEIDVTITGKSLKEGYSSKGLTYRFEEEEKFVTSSEKSASNWGSLLLKRWVLTLLDF